MAKSAGTEKVVVIYGNGESKKGSVRFKAVSVADETVSVISLGDYYVARTVLDKLGIKDNEQVRVTFEKG